MTALWWIRRDLRLDHNETLQKALTHESILPVYVLDPVLVAGSGERRQNFLYENLRLLDSDLKERGSYLVIRKGKPVDVLGELLQETKADVIYAEEDYTPYARLRSVLVGGALPLQLVQDQLGIHPLANLKKNGKPYTVYTPFKRSWLSLFPEINLQTAPEIIPTIPKIKTDPLPAGKENELFPAGEKAAHERLRDFFDQRIYGYNQNRDRMDLNGTSQLSPYIHFGVLGMRNLEKIAFDLLEDLKDESRKESVSIWLSELIWREFYIHILYHFPQVRSENFRSKYDSLQWRNDPADFNAWKEGRTGYPVVDAGMRQLLATGWMHNRARMITASFLVKHLLIDWRRGEEFFREQLVDGDLAVNNGSWQWVAGTGTDAAPYFRIFNPILQSQKFDPEGLYIKQWVPELRDLNKKEIHMPWEFEVKNTTYPDPIVDHKAARERALLTYKMAAD